METGAVAALPNQIRIPGINPLIGARIILSIAGEAHREKLASPETPP